MLGAEAVEVVGAGRRAAAEAEQPVSELLAVVGKHAGDLHRRGALQVARGKRRALAAVLAG